MGADTVLVVIHFGNPAETALGVGLVVVGLIIAMAIINGVGEIVLRGRDG